MTADQSYPAAPQTRHSTGCPAILLRATRTAIVALVAAFASLQTAFALDCAATAPCTLGGSQYIAVPPDRWAGHNQLKLAVFLHGYQSNAAEVVADKALLAAFKTRGVLLVAPSGQGGRWSVPGTPGTGRHSRDDVAYIALLLDDVARRFPIDRGDMTAVGFSLGGSFVWTIACQHPALFKHYVAFAGGFWRPHPERCASGPVDLIHIHGLADETVPMSGRAIRKTFRQGDIPEGLAFWRKTKACGPLAGLPANGADLTCSSARGCIGVTSITACTHKYGHWVDPKWLSWALSRIYPKQ